MNIHASTREKNFQFLSQAARDITVTLVFFLHFHHLKPLLVSFSAFFFKKGILTLVYTKYFLFVCVISVDINLDLLIRYEQHIFLFRKKICVFRVSQPTLSKLSATKTFPPFVVKKNLYKGNFSLGRGEIITDYV